MTIVSEFIEIIEQISKSIELPKIKDILLPPQINQGGHSKKLNFGAIQLEDDTIGVIYLNLTPEIKKVSSSLDTQKYIGMESFELAKRFSSSDILDKTLGLGAINAISQLIFRKANFSFDYTTDSMGLLNLSPGDVVGMVGFFGRLIKKIERFDLKLVIIEKKEEFVKKSNNWEVTMDPKRLKQCNKILCTSTTVLNESIDDILKYCRQAEKVSLIGPTAGFIPDPLFDRGVDVIGGTNIVNPANFVDLFNQNQRWGTSGKKYCIQKENYAGIKTLLNQINDI